MWRLSFVALIACAQPQPVTREQLTSALASVQTAMPEVADTTGFPVTISITPVPDGADARFGEGILDGVIQINPTISYCADLPVTLLHELGHAVGLPHSPDTSSVMFTNETCHHPTLEVGIQQIRSACAIQTCRRVASRFP